MNFARTTVSLLLLAALGTSAQAQSGKTREQVRAELAEAIRTGNVLANGDTGLKLNELYPQRYPHSAAAVVATRAQVKADLAGAVRTGDVIASGETGLKLNEQFPQRLSRRCRRCRQDTRAGDRGNRRSHPHRRHDRQRRRNHEANEEFPQRYAKARSLYAGKTQESTTTAANTLSR